MPKPEQEILEEIRDLLPKLKKLRNRTKNSRERKVLVGLVGAAKQVVKTCGR
jgi:hypothetical protein